jgi:hypothetical protein
MTAGGTAMTDFWYDLELRGLAGSDAGAELIREAEAAQPSAGEPDLDPVESCP